MNYLSLKNYFTIFFCISVETFLFSQSISPGIANKQIDWAMKTPSGQFVYEFPTSIGQNQPTNQLQSGEDWWYDTDPIYEGGVHTGYIVCGFTTYKNIAFTEENTTPKGFCLKNPTDNLTTIYNELITIPGDCERRTIANEWLSGYKATLARYDLNGKLLWCKPSNHATGLNAVIQTSDGGFIAIGDSFGATYRNDGSIFSMNPTTTLEVPITSQLPINYSTTRKDHIIVTKFDANGNELWSYLYGSQMFGSDPVTNQSIFENFCTGSGQDIALNPITGGYTIVGNINIAGTNIDPVMIININANGKIVNPLTDIKLFDGVTTKYYARSIDCKSGNCIIGMSDNTNGKLLKINQNDLTISSSWATNPLTFVPQNYLQVIEDVLIDNSGNSVITAIDFQSGASFSGVNYGIGKIIKIDNNGVVNASNSFGEVRAYDLKIGITQTSDNNYAIVSSKLKKDPSGNPLLANTSTQPLLDIITDFNVQATIPQSQQYCNNTLVDVWNTDTYVAKFNQSLSLVWEKQFDSDNQSPTFHPSDFKKQECMYRIAPGADGSLFVVGNSSHNLDDYFAAKIFSDCQNYLNYDTKDITDNVIDITGTQTWNSPRKVIGKVVIKNGATLNITNTTIEFADTKRVGIDTRIVVEVGGKLIINNSTLTSIQGCEKAIWYGIEVQGNPTLRQNPISNQGYAEINNSIVSNAFEAFSTRSLLASDNLTTDWTKTGGGIIKSINTQFINNRRSFEFMAYQATTNTGALINDASTIRLSTFQTTPAFGNGGTLVDPAPHITMWKTRNITLLGNNFQNLRPAVAADKKGIAISTVDASFVIDQTCSGIATPSNPCPAPNVKTNFTDLYIGVIVSNGASSANFSVKNAIFNNNLYGVRVGGSDYGIITNNTFNIPNAKIANLTKYAYGVYMDGAFGCVVEENIFNDNGSTLVGSLSGAQNMGVYIANADFAGGGVKHYRNDFTNMDVSTQVAGQNTTLQVDCNRFFHPNAANFTDLSVPVGVLATQGDCGPLGNQDRTLPQANEFSGSCNGTSRKQVQSNTTSNWDYKSYPFTQVGVNIPCFVGSQNLIQCGVPGGGFNRFLACPQSSGTITGISGLITTNTQSKNQVNNLIDGGNTTSVLATIEAATNGNTLRNQLAAFAPYLSEEALFAVLDKNIAPGQKKQILEVNAPFTSVVRTKIQNSSLPNGHKNLLLATTGESALTTILNTTAAYDREQALNNNDLVRVYLEENQVTEAYNYLKTIGNVQALCAMIPINLSRDTSQTGDLIDSLRAMALMLNSTNPLEAERMTDFCNLYATLLKFESRVGGLYSITEPEKNSLQALALKQPMFAPTIYGRLNFLEENYPYLDAYNLDGTKSGQLQTSQAGGNSTPLTTEIVTYDYNLYPNPTNELLNFDFGLGYETEKAISIFGLSGELILKISTSEDVFEINTKQFENGLYIVQVQFSSEQKEILTKRLSVQH